jgi:hypothetical protein
LQQAIAALEHIDIDAEVQAHRDLEALSCSQEKTIDEHNDTFDKLMLMMPNKPNC